MRSSFVKRLMLFGCVFMGISGVMFSFSFLSVLYFLKSFFVDDAFILSGIGLGLIAAAQQYHATFERQPTRENLFLRMREGEE